MLDMQLMGDHYCG